MKKLIVNLVCLVLVFACSESPERKAQKILEKAIEAHGGQDAWDKISVLEFRKWTLLRGENGEVESELDQYHEFRFKPYFEGKITWTKDSIPHVLSFDGANISYFMGGNEVKNESFLASKKKDFDAAFYTVAQPWKLMDGGGTLIYEGQKTLENGQTVESIKVDYGPESDTWWYYFDAESFLMAGSEVQLKDHRSLVYDISMEQSDGMKLHGKRESRRIGGQGQKLFLRAEYQYSDYIITY
jgi:hypothetical protein